MTNENFPKNINLSFQENDDHALSEQINRQKNHADTDSSSLYGLIGDNITYVTPGATNHGYGERMWNWVWKDLVIAFLGLLSVFFKRYK